MKVLSPKSVYLAEGEVAPVFCRCGAIYQPKAGSEKSTCPKCFKTNFHEDAVIVPEMRQ